MKKLIFGIGRFLGAAGRATVALVGVCGVVAALANYTMTQGVGTTFGSLVVSSVHYIQTMVCDPTTPANCGGVKAGNTAAVADVAQVVSDPNVVAAINGPIPGCAAAPCLTTIGNIGIDPSSGASAPAEAFLALPATTTTQIVALSGTTKTYVTSRLLFSGGTVNVTFKYGTGSNCGTGTTTLDGPWPVIAQAGFSEAGSPVMVVPSGQALCVTTDASVSGGVKLIYQQK